VTVTVPERAPLAGGRSWQLTDYVRKLGEGKTDGTGAGTIRFNQLDAGRMWQITRAVIACTASVAPAPTCDLYVVPAGAEPDQRYLVSGTRSGLFDEADYPDEGIWILEGEQLLAVWAGAPANARITANIQAHLMEQQ
jgi:hypothetical protein